MSEDHNTPILTEPHEKLIDLVEYVHQMVELNQKPVFSVKEYKHLLFHEYELKNRTGINHDLSDEDGPVWLKVDRLKRIDPPVAPEAIKEWLTVSRDPFEQPEIKRARTETLEKEEADKLVEEGTLFSEDVQQTMKPRPGRDLADVIYRLERLPKIKHAIEKYLSEEWTKWSENEKPRRRTIAIYDKFFSTLQTLVSEGSNEPLEFVWGVGVARWKTQKTVIDHPLIEQLVDLQVNAEDGSITVRPRSSEPYLAIKPYFALDNAGVNAVLNFGREFFTQCSEEEEFSPFNHGSFEPVLRGAVTHLDEHGQYHPDQLKSITDRSLPEVTGTLTITDTWAIYARKRSDNFFLSDLNDLKKAIGEAGELPGPAKRLVTEPPATGGYNPTIIDLGSGLKGFTGGGDGSVGGGRLSSTAATIDDTVPQDFFFPKRFNEEQISIIKQLSNADGVVVQGPPGTGKTHTIANIICHYLATGKRVLVTSQKEAALSVLREHIPENIRELTISLLTNEQAGLKQLEAAVRLLANTISQRDPKKLEYSIVANQSRIIELQTRITQINAELRKWAGKHLRRVKRPDDSSFLPMELAKEIVATRGEHSWFPDTRLSVKNEPQFSDKNIHQVRLNRKKVGNDLIYLNEELPSLSDLPDAASLVAIHQDLTNAQRLDQQAQRHGIAILSLSAPNAIQRAESLLKSVEKVIEFLQDIEKTLWLERIFAVWRREGRDSRNAQLFTELASTMDPISARRQDMLRAAITMPDAACTDPLVGEAVSRAARGERPFGLMPFGKSEARKLFSQICVQGRTPKNPEEWKQVEDCICWRQEIASFVSRWNHLRNEYDLPELMDEGEITARWISEMALKIEAGVNILVSHRPLIESEVPELFPFGINAQAIIVNSKSAKEAAEAIELNLSKYRLTASRSRVVDLRERLAKSDTPITNALHAFITKKVGNIEISTTDLASKWEDLCRELTRLHELRPAFETIQRVTGAIESSGASKWAAALRTQAVIDADDPWTPGNWRVSWEWTQRNTYLKDIDGRERIRKLSEDLLKADADLKRLFQKVVEYRTYLGLFQSLTDRVRASLTMFMTAIQKIGKGTGIRARRFRRNAQDAMERCYSAVPCWIMPLWRVSETLPSALGSFDLVIVDEASQSDISSLPALVRGKKVIIVGDDRQVSPTAGFIEERKILQLRHNYLKNQPYADLVLPGGSLYSLSKAMFPGQNIMLREHFRCVEPIIRFSSQFYPEKLIPLRLPATSERLDPPLIDVYVANGHKNRKKINIQEAGAIVDEIERLVNDPNYDNRSIGVVSLIGGQQAHYIQGLLLERIGEEAFLKHRIACGDSATFQGKERHIMFISMVACPKSKNAITGLHFEQRFNVALSRARDREYLFRSVTEEMLSPNDLKAKVIRHFKSPMPAKNMNGEDLFKLCDSDFERDVLGRLLSDGYNVIPQVNVGGFSIDLVVEGAEGRRLAVELDGDKYHPPEQWAEDYARQRTLERMGWTFWRCWGSSFAMDPDACMTDLISQLNKMGIEPLSGKYAPAIFSEHRVVGAPDISEEPPITEFEEPVEKEIEEADEIIVTAHAEGWEEEEHELGIQAKYAVTEAEVSAAEEDESSQDLVDDAGVALYVQPDDRVLISYNDEPSRQYTITLSRNRHDPDDFVINSKMPLAQALMGYAEEDEVDIPAGGRKRTITILRIDRPAESMADA